MTEPTDSPEPRPVTDSEVVFKGRIWDVVRDTVDLGTAGSVVREYVRHPGAVAIMPMDEADRILLQRQYRHPVRYGLWELPAGLLDQAGEPPLEAARRELAEEADLRAGRWDTLVDWFSSPGGSSEALRMYLARELSPVPLAERFEREAEEAGLEPRWLALDEAVEGVLAGRIVNPNAVIGILAAHTARGLGWRTLRPADAPWEMHPAFRSA